MEFQFNKEGVQYLLGLPSKQDSIAFSQMVVSSDDLGWLPLETLLTCFCSLTDAERARKELRSQLDREPLLYQVTIRRVQSNRPRKR